METRQRRIDMTQAERDVLSDAISERPEAGRVEFNSYTVRWVQDPTTLKLRFSATLGSRFPAVVYSNGSPIGLRP